MRNFRITRLHFAVTLLLSLFSVMFVAESYASTLPVEQQIELTKQLVTPAVITEFIVLDVVKQALPEIRSINLEDGITPEIEARCNSPSVNYIR